MAEYGDDITAAAAAAAAAAWCACCSGVELGALCISAWIAGGSTIGRIGSASPCMHAQVF